MLNIRPTARVFCMVDGRKVYGDAYENAIIWDSGNYAMPGSVEVQYESEPAPAVLRLSADALPIAA